MKYKKIVIAGGTGFLGKLLLEHFKPKTERIVVLTRSVLPCDNTIEYVFWDGKHQGNWVQYIDGSDIWINLCGKSVDCRYTKKNKARILSSRIDSTRALGKALIQCKNPPMVWMNSSTATIYRHSLDQQMDEDTGEIGSGFSVNVAKTWEEAFFSFNTKNTRKVALRTAIVLGKRGGALIPIKKLASIGFGGKQGKGNQWVSWIHQNDFVRAMEFIINTPGLSGPVNITSPFPKRNRILMQKLREIMNIPFGIPLPNHALELGARIIKTETELVLKSRNVIPKKLLDLGFKFYHTELTQSFNDLLK